MRTTPAEGIPGSMRPFAWGQVQSPPAPASLRQQGAPSLTVTAAPVYFDFPLYISPVFNDGVERFAAPTSRTVVGDYTFVNAAPTTPFPLIKVPGGSRCFIDQIDTRAEDVFGRPIPWRIFATTDPSVVWRIYFGGRSVWTSTQPDRSGVADRPLVEAKAGESMSVGMTLVADTDKQVAMMGIRIRGRMVSIGPEGQPVL